MLHFVDDQPPHSTRGFSEEPVWLLVQPDQRARREAEEGMHRLATNVHRSKPGRRKDRLRGVWVFRCQRTDEVALACAGAPGDEDDRRALIERFPRGCDRLTQLP